MQKTPQQSDVGAVNDSSTVNLPNPLSKQKLENEYDYVFIGSSLSHLGAAFTLARKGAKVAVLEEQEDFGECLKISPDHAEWPLSLECFPDHGELQLGFESLQSLVDVGRVSNREGSCKTIEGGQTKAFLGFGDSGRASADLLLSLNASRWVQTGNPALWVQQFLDRGDFHRKTLHKVTKIETKASQWTVEINGSFSLVTSNLVYGQPPHSLLPLLPPGVLNSRSLTRLAKAEGWGRLALCVRHPRQILQTDDIWFLPGAKDREPLVGRFFSRQSQDTPISYSFWMTLMPPESGGDVEALGECVKGFKKVLKKAFPDEFGEVIAERLLVHEEAEGHLTIKGLEGSRLSELPGVYFSSPLLVGGLELGAQLLNLTHLLRELNA